MDDVRRLEAEIKAQHGTVYQFCKASGLPRSTTSEVLRGVYRGNAEAQLARIRAALLRQNPVHGRTMQALKRVACARCSRSGPCSLCDSLFADQAHAVLSALEL